MANWPTNYEMQTSSSWTTKFPRPVEGGPHHPAVLESRQKEWDAAEARRKELVATAQKIRADRAARKEAEREAAAAREEARRQAKNGETEAMLRRRFIAAGGSEAEWQAEKTEVISEHRRRMIAQGDAEDARARAAQAVLYRSL